MIESGKNPEWAVVWPLGENVVVVDGETTGLHPYKHSMFELAAIAADGAFFNARFRPRVSSLCEAAAADVNGRSWADLDEETTSWTEALTAFFFWLEELGIRGPVMAGITPTFDLSFVQAAWNLLEKPKRFFPFAHRTLDLHALVCGWCLVNGRSIGERGLNTDHIYRTLGMEPEPKPHIAMRGAEWEMRAFRRWCDMLAAFALFPAKEGEA